MRRYTVIGAGPVARSEAVKKMWDYIKANMAEFYDSIVAQMPLGRLGNPDEVAKAIAFATGTPTRGSDAFAEGSATPIARWAPSATG